MTAALSSATRALLLEQLAAACRHGLPAREVVEIMAQDLGLAAADRRALAELASGLGPAESPVQAMARLPQTFVPATLAWVALDESSEGASQTLQALADDARIVAATRRGARLALLWPASVALVIVAMLIMLGTFVLPAFREAYASFGSELPEPSRLVFAFVEGLTFTVWLWLPLLVVLGVLARLGKLPPQLGRAADTVLGSIGFVRRYRQASFVRRLLRCLQPRPHDASYRAAALAHLGATAGAAEFAQAAQAMQRGAGLGLLLSDVLARAPALPVYLSLYVRLGERMGELDATLGQLTQRAAADEEEAALRFERGCILVLYLFLGGAVAVALVATYLPIFKLGSII